MGYKIDLAGQEQHFRRREKKTCKCDIHVTKPALYLNSFVFHICLGGLDEDKFFSCMLQSESPRDTMTMSVYKWFSCSARGSCGEKVPVM